jgi:tetratricopeptide (TPR) repeat protein
MISFLVRSLLGLTLLGACVSLSQTPDVAARFRLAQSYEQGGDYESAARLYKELLAKDSLNTVYFDGLRRMYMQLKHYDDAIALIEKRLSVNPTDLNLRGLLGSAYYKEGKEAEANAQWERAIAQEPANPNLYRMMANILMENRLLDKTADLYRRARVACKDPNLFTIDLAQLLSVTMDFAGATTEYVRLLKQNPTQLAFVQGRMASFTAKPEARAAALEVVRTTLKKEEDPRFYELLAWLYLEGRDFDAASDVYKTIDKITKGQGSALFSFAERAFKERAYTVAARAYLDAINAPLPAARLPAAKYGYALTLKELSAVSDTLHGAYSLGAVPVTESQPGYAGAVAYFKQIIAEYPHTEFSARSYYQIGTIQFERYFDLDGAIKSFEQVEKELPGLNIITYEVSLKIGQILTARGDTTQAATRYWSVINAPNATPDNQDEATFRIAELEYFSGRFEQSIQHLGQLSTNLTADFANDALALMAFLQENKATVPQALTQFARADFLARQRKNTEAIPLFLKVIEQYPQALLVDDALMKTASLQAQAGLLTDALASYERLLAQFKETSIARDKAQFNIGEIYDVGLKEKAKAIAAYEKLLADHPNSLLTSQARKRIRELRGDSL